MDKGIPGVTRWKAFGVAAVVTAAIAAGLFLVYPGLLGPSRTASDASLLNSLREATPPVLEPGTVVYLESFHKLGPLIVEPSLAKDLLPWDTASYDYRTESWQLVGDDGKLAKSYYRKVSPDGTVLEEDFRDAEVGREHNYFPRTGALLSYSWSGGAATLNAQQLESLLSHGHRLSERAEVAGFPGLVFEQQTSSVSVPVGSPAKPLCLTPGWGVSLDGPRPPPTGRPSPVPVCPEPSDFVPAERVTRGIYGVEPLGIPLGSADIFLDKNGRQALLSGYVTTRWETIPASAAPPQLFAWEPPCEGDRRATGTGPVYCDTSK